MRIGLFYMLLVLLGVTLVAGACDKDGVASGDSDADSDTDVDTDSDGNTDNLVPFENGSRVEGYAFNLVGDDLHEELREYLNQPTDIPVDQIDPDDRPSLGNPARVFYTYFRDEYDFLFFVGIEEMSQEIGGLHSWANTNNIPGTGVEASGGGEWYGDMGGLMSIIGFNFIDFRIRPPFAHEVAHHWAMHLDPSIGFGDAFVGGQASHWGTTSVNGILGGFEGDSLRCKTPAGAKPPGCTPEPDSRIQYMVNSFSPLSGTYWDKPYAPLELYMMGLMTHDEIPQSYTLLVNAAPDPVATDASAGTMTVEADGVASITVDDIIAVEGVRDPLPEADRHFRGALVVLSPEPASDEMMETASLWAASFGGHVNDAPWPSFEALSGGTGTFDMSLGTRREVNEDIYAYDTDTNNRPAGECDIFGDDCGDGEACYDYNQSVCLVEGSGLLGDSCKSDNDCGKGLACPWRSQCELYCQLDDPTSDRSCETLCPGASIGVIDPMTFKELGGICQAKGQ